MTLVIGLFLNVSSTHRGNFYQVISSHPHDVEEFLPHVETAYQNGRLWVVKVKANAPQKVMKHLELLDGGEKSYIYKSFSKKLQHKLRDSISIYTQQVSKENIRQDVVELASFKNRRAGSAENQEAVKRSMNTLLDYGYEVKEICYSASACSVIADKKGSFSDEVLLVMGHIDSVGASFAGADDNASGTAVLLEMARILKDYDSRKNIRFFITNGEELGLIGATHYVKQLVSQNQIKSIGLAINMDMVGYNKNGLVELETEPEFESIAKSFAELAARYTNLKTKITLGAWGSDHVPFLKQGVPSILTIENWDTKTPCYHKECDKPETLNYEYAAEIGKLNIAAILQKDQL